MEPIKDAFHRRLRFGHEVHAIITGVARAATTADVLTILSKSVHHAHLVFEKGCAEHSKGTKWGR